MMKRADNLSAEPRIRLNLEQSNSLIADQVIIGENNNSQIEEEKKEQEHVG